MQRFQFHNHSNITLSLARFYWWCLKSAGLIWDVQISFTTFLVQHFHVRNLNGGTLLKIFLATSRLLDHYHFHLLNFSDATLLHSQLCLCNTFTFTILLFVLLVWQILCLICDMWITFYHHGRWPYRRGTSCQGRSNPWKIARYHFIQQKLGCRYMINFPIHQEVGKF